MRRENLALPFKTVRRRSCLNTTISSLSGARRRSFDWPNEHAPRVVTGNVSRTATAATLLDFAEFPPLPRGTTSAGARCYSLTPGLGRAPFDGTRTESLPGVRRTTLVLAAPGQARRQRIQYLPFHQTLDYPLDSCLGPSRLYSRGGPPAVLTSEHAETVHKRCIHTYTYYIVMCAHYLRFV